MQRRSLELAQLASGYMCGRRFVISSVVIIIIIIIAIFELKTSEKQSLLVIPTHMPQLDDPKIIVTHYEANKSDNPRAVYG